MKDVHENIIFTFYYFVLDLLIRHTLVLFDLEIPPNKLIVDNLFDILLE